MPWSAEQREGDPVEDVSLADQHLLVPEASEHLIQDDRAGGDDVSPSRLHCRQPPAGRDGHGAQPRGEVGDGIGGKPGAVDDLGTVGVKAEVQGRQRGDGPGGADQRGRGCRVDVVGQGIELAQVRPYVEGDDVRYMDWSATARTRSSVTVRSCSRR